MFLTKLVDNTSIFLSYNQELLCKAVRGTSSHRINSKSEQSMQPNAIYINNQPSHE